MKTKRAFRRAAALICAAALLVNLIPPAWAAGAFLRAGSTSALPGETRTVYVSGSNLETLAGVEGIISYDDAALELTGAAVVGDMAAFSSVNTATAGQVSFEGACLDGISGAQDILRLDFRVKEDAAAGEYLLDVLITKACNTALATVPLSGVSGVFAVTEPQPTVKTVYFYGSSDSSTLHKGERVNITARVSDSQGLAAGKLEFRYDAALFTCVAAEPLSALSGAMETLDTSRAGYVSAAFASEEALPGGELLRLTLEAAANVDASASVAFAAADLYDTALAAMNGVGFTHRVTLCRTETVAETPALRAVMPAEVFADETLTATVVLDKDSGLAAGDFCISYDTDALTCVGVEENADLQQENGVYIMTNPTIDGGEVRFSVICQTGLTKGASLLTVTFQPKKVGTVTLTPSITTSAVDADRQPITLDLRAAACDVKDPFVTVTFRDEDGTELSRQTVRIGNAAEPPEAHKAPDAGYHYTLTGWGGDYTRITADTVFTAQYEKAAHTVAVDEAVPPTCTQPGATEGSHCTVCGAVLLEQETVEATGHDEVVDKAVAPTYARSGLTEGRHCAVCGAVLLEQEVLEALGFTISGTVTGYAADAVVSLLKGEEVVARGSVQADGTFRLSPVLVDEGDYTLRVDGAACVPWGSTVTLSDDCGSVSMDCLLTRVGDVNGDGAGAEDDLRCALDLQTLYEYLSLRHCPDTFCGVTDLETQALYRAYFLRVADVNGDGSVNILDYQQLYLLMRAG